MRRWLCPDSHEEFWGESIMGKKIGCFNSLKRKLLGSRAKLKPEKNCGLEKGKRELVDMKQKSGCPPSMVDQIRPSPPPLVPSKLFNGAEEERSKRAVAVAIATAAAAEAAVAAAEAAAQVVRLTGKGESYYQLKSTRRESAAIRIQSAFRGYLARKALRALKGLVKLQALIRGHMVRRQAEDAFRSMQALQRIQSQLRSRRLRIAEEKNREQKFELQRHVEVKRRKILKKELRCNGREIMDRNQHKRCEDSQLLKEQTEAKLLSRQQATLRRERAKGYHLENQDKKLVRKLNASTSCVKQCHSNNEKLEWSWVDRWIDTHPYNRSLDSSSASSIELNSPSDKQILEAKISLDALLKEQEVQNKLNFTESKRRSLRSRSWISNCRKPTHCTIMRDDESNASSTASLPSYMVYTESAKAKVRSSSTPRQRMSASSVYMNSFPSLISDSSTTMLKRIHSSQQKSLGSKGQPQSDRISSSIKCYNLNSESSFLNCGQQRLCR